jgi:predicted AlkP superfamily pyrophosphatase or phosphodiesterase
MQRLLIFSALILFSITVQGQSPIQRPKLVVGIVVDQMRWDYLYRYYDRYKENGGFKRLLNQGFACENTFIPYTPTYTACGHASIFTGSVPAIHGITGNNWWDSKLNKSMYCTQDDSVKTVGSITAAGQMSPRNLLTTTVGDEMKLATNFKSKVVGIALKDRGGILSAGHSADAAYWLDSKTGDWISSSYYMNELPKWLKELNEKKLINEYYQRGWSTLYPIETYVQSTADLKPYENITFGAGSHFPYDLTKYIGRSYSHIMATPFGNSITIEISKSALVAEQLGMDNFTDMLAVSFSSPDYIGHTFGPNSIEAEDGFLRLDQELGAFLDFLDQKVGKEQYLLFLTADHGAAHVPGFLKEHKVPAGHINNEKLYNDLDSLLKTKFKKDNLVLTIENYQIFLNHQLISTSNLNKNLIKKAIIDYVVQLPGISNVIDLESLEQTTLNFTIKNKIANGYFPSRSGDIQFIYIPQWLDNFEAGGTTHGLWNAYDSHIPLLWYGWNIKPGRSYREIQMTDIAPTISALLKIQMPSGSVGKVIEEIMR